MSKKPKAPPSDPSVSDNDEGLDGIERTAGENPTPEEQPPADEPSPPTQAEKDEGLLPLKREDAEQLLRSGHRLRRIGDDPANWVTMTRHADDYVLAFAATKEAIDDVLSHDLTLAV